MWPDLGTLFWLARASSGNETRGLAVGRSAQRPEALDAKRADANDARPPLPLEPQEETQLGSSTLLIAWINPFDRSKLQACHAGPAALASMASMAAASGKSEVLASSVRRIR